MISKSREKTRELNSTQIHSFISELQAEVFPTYIGLNIQQKPMKNKAKQSAKWRGGRGPKSEQVQKQKQKATTLFRTVAPTSNKHNFQNLAQIGSFQSQKKALRV